MVWNWKPGVNMYIDVAVIDPTAQTWRDKLLLNGPGRAAFLKGQEKRDYYKNHFDLVDKIHEFSPFVLEAQGGVGETALKVIKAIKGKRSLPYEAQ